MIFGSWVNHIKYGASEILAHFADFFGAGCVHPATDFALTFPATPNMTCTVGAGVARVSGYRIFNDGVDTVTLTFPTAHATLDRVDLVQVGMVDESLVDIRLGTAQNLGRITVKAGTPASGPVHPSPDAKSVPLYAVLVRAGATSVTAGDVTDLRALVPFFFTALGTPMTAVGDMISGGASGAMVRVPGNISATRKFLSQVGTGGEAGEPTWESILATDLPTLDKIPGPVSEVSMDMHRITNLAEPMGSQDACTRNFAMSLASQYATQYAGVTRLSATTILDATFSKQLIICEGSSYTIVLPAANTYAAGKNLSFMSVASGTILLQVAGVDGIGVTNGSSVQALTLNAGDTVNLVSNGSNLWYAADGSVQYADSSSAFISAIGARLKAEPGMIMMYGGGSPPEGWLMCDGGAVSRTQYAALYGVLGTSYGVGNGITTFNVPDLRGRFPVGSGAGANLTSRALGDKGGEEKHILSAAELPTHNHSVTLTDAGHAHTYDTLFVSGNVAQSGSGTNSYTGDTRTTSASSSNVHISEANVGSNTSHENMPPFLGVGFVIKY